MVSVKANAKTILRADSADMHPNNTRNHSKWPDFQIWLKMANKHRKMIKLPLKAKSSKKILKGI